MATHMVLAAIRVASPKPLLTSGRSRIAASPGVIAADTTF